MYEFREPVPAPADGTYPADPVGVIEVADRIGVNVRSVHKMIQRDVMPHPDHQSVNGSRAWEWRTILWWAGETKRLTREELRDEYRRTFRKEPPVPRKKSTPNGVVVRPDPTPDLPNVPSIP